MHAHSGLWVSKADATLSTTTKWQKRENSIRYINSNKNKNKDMVLPTMNDEEKAFEAFRIYNTAISVYDDFKSEIWDKFGRGTRFPYVQRIRFNDDRNNKWLMLIICKSKKAVKKGQFWSFCYTTYEIEKKRKNGSNKIDGNTGKGILAIDPFAMKSKVNGSNRGLGMVIDIVPHAFNRYTERYLKPLGLENIEFARKVESIVLRWMHFDVVGDESSKNNEDKGIAPYDVFMDGGGILRGYMVNEILLRFFSYVSDDMMYENQKEWQDKMNSEYYHWVNNGTIGTNKVKDI